MRNDYSFRYWNRWRLKKKSFLTNTRVYTCRLLNKKKKPKYDNHLYLWVNYFEIKPFLFLIQPLIYYLRHYITCYNKFSYHIIQSVNASVRARARVYVCFPLKMIILCVTFGVFRKQIMQNCLSTIIIKRC